MPRELTHEVFELRLSPQAQEKLNGFANEGWEIERVMTYRDSLNGAHVLYVFKREVQGIKDKPKREVSQLEAAGH